MIIQWLHKESTIFPKEYFIEASKILSNHYGYFPKKIGIYVLPEKEFLKHASNIQGKEVHPKLLGFVHPSPSTFKEYVADKKNLDYQRMIEAQGVFEIGLKEGITEFFTFLHEMLHIYHPEKTEAEIKELDNSLFKMVLLQIILKDK